MSPRGSENVVGNFYDKYSSKNPVERALMGAFLRAVTGFYTRIAPITVLEVGCGEGHLAQHLVTHCPRPMRFVACDLELSAVKTELDGLIELRPASIYALPFDDASFDLVICCEVLEHLSEPKRALAEVARVAGRGVIVSTPREPLWCVMNMMRGKYLRQFGNTPGHVRHFSRRRLHALVATQLHVVETRCPIPWTVLLAEPRATGPAPTDARPLR